MLKANYMPPGEPVSLEYQGKNYIGKLTKVPGASGLNVWHLMVNNYYWGTLTFTDKWVFNTQKRDMKELANFFGRT